MQVEFRKKKARKVAWKGVREELDSLGLMHGSGEGG